MLYGILNGPDLIVIAQGVPVLLESIVAIE